MRKFHNVLSKYYFNLPLRYKFIIPTIAVILISFLSVSVYFTHDQRAKQEARLHEKAERISYLLISSNLESIWDVDLENLERNCQAFFEDEEITRLIIIDTFYGEDVLINLSKELRGTSDIVKTADFVKGDKKVAKLEVVFSNYFIERNLAQLRNTLVVLSVLVFLLMVGLIRVVSQIALMPLQGLMTGVKHLKTGNLTFRIPVQSQDELGKLAVSFNTMADELNLYHDHLHELVEKRTTELTTANEHLHQEIAERKRAEKAIAEHQTFLQRVIDADPNFIFVKDRESRFVLVNQALADAYGTTVENLLGKSDPDFNPNKEETDHFHRDDLEVIDGQQEKFIPEEQITTAAGEVRWLQTIKRPLIEEDGVVHRLLGVASDISKRKRAEDELRGSREKYRDLYEDAKKTEELYHSLLDSTPDAIIVYDIDGHTQFINDAFTNTFGWILDELQDGAPYVPDSEKEITGIKIKKVVQDGIPVSNFETKRLTKGGRLVDVSISASRFNDHEDNPAGMLVTLHDITERKQAEEKLRKYSKTQEVLLREVNHRVKNNLSAIIGMLYKEEDRAKAEGITDYLAFLGDLKGRIDRLSTVHSLLSASGWRPLLLSRLCEQVINAVLQSVPLNTKISMEIKDSPVRVNSNQAHHLTLVINELATNTLKHALADRDSVRINVDILQENNDVHIIFRDDGSGYPKEMVEGDFGHANVGFDLINGIVEESLRGRVILKNENGAVTNIVFKHDSAQD